MKNVHFRVSELSLVSFTNACRDMSVFHQLRSSLGAWIFQKKAFYRLLHFKSAASAPAAHEIILSSQQSAQFFLKCVDVFFFLSLEALNGVGCCSLKLWFYKEREGKCRPFFLLEWRKVINNRFTLFRASVTTLQDHTIFVSPYSSLVSRFMCVAQNEIWWGRGARHPALSRKWWILCG